MTFLHSIFKGIPQNYNLEKKSIILYKRKNTKSRTLQLHYVQFN